MAYPSDVARFRALVRKFAKSGLVASTGIDLESRRRIGGRPPVASEAFRALLDTAEAASRRPRASSRTDHLRRVDDAARVGFGRLFEFVRDARIPWHNNAGERAIRSICVKRKMSGGMRSEVGARTYARLKSVHETAKRKGQGFLAIVIGALTRIFGGQSPRGARGASTA